MKKKVIIAAVVAVSVLAGAVALFGSSTEPVYQADPGITTPATEAVVETVPETIPAPTEPEWEPGISRAAYGEAIYSWLELDMEVEVIGAFKDYYVVSGEEYDLLVEKRFIRLEGEEPFEIWKGYARQGAKVFESVYMVDSKRDKTTDELADDPIATLTENTLVNVVEGRGDWLFIEWEEGEGYVHVDQISLWRITHGGGGTGDSGGGSAPADGTDVDVGSLSATGFQGGIVLLGEYYGPGMDEESETGKGLVIARNVEAYIYLLSREDEAKVIAHDEEYCTIYLGDGLTAKLPRWLLRLEGDEEYESWTGYAQSSALVYEEYQMRNEMKTLIVNTEVLVLDKLPDCYVVMVTDEIGYMEFDAVSETEIVNYGGGTGGGGGNGGSGDVWTPPAL